MTPQEVLDTSVAQLETLAAFLHEQLGEGSDGPGRVTPETRACNEILRSLRALILRVRTREGLAGWNPSSGWPVPYDGGFEADPAPSKDLKILDYCAVE